MRWPWQRRGQAPAPALTFDASIDIDANGRDLDVLAAVRDRVSAIAGADWVSVEPHAGGERGIGIRLFPAGTSLESTGPTWSALRETVLVAVREVLAHWPQRHTPAWAVPEPAAQGFAEAMAPSQFDALAELAALAELTKPKPTAKAAPKPAPKPLPEPVAPDLTDDVERLAHLLGFVLPVDGRDPATAAIRRFGSFAAVLAAPEAELRRVAGLGTHSIAAIKLVHAAAIRLARAGVASAPVLDDRQRLADYLAAALGRERIEQFRILFLDENGMLRADEVQASGTVNHTPVYPREVVRRALALGAASLVLVHNHPSGDPEPSRDDLEMTKQVQAAARVMAIDVRDHVIVGNGRWLSFRDEGLLD